MLPLEFVQLKVKYEHVDFYSGRTMPTEPGIMNEPHPQIPHQDQLSTRPYRIDISRYLSSAAHRPGRILDLGCGPGACDLKAMKSLGSSALVGIDMSSDLNNKDSDIYFVRSDIDDRGLPFLAESFDIVLLHNVIEHLHDPLRVLREAHRVLAPGGVLSIVTENQVCLRNRLKSLMGLSIYFPINRWMSQEDRVEKSGRLVCTGHVREYTRQEIKQMLRRSGFMLDVLKLHAAAYPANQVSEGSSSGACMFDTMSTNHAMLRLYNVFETILPGCRYMICAIASKRAL